MLDDIKIVLSHTTHPGNIGAAARALKTMGLRHLRLVNPTGFPSAEATRRASRADDILASAQVFTSIEDAIADCRLIIGTSDHSRTLPWPMLEPRAMAERIRDRKDDRPVAIIFGTEKSGLTNKEFQLCHYHVCIPTNAEYSSLNVASAIQLIAYELRLASLSMSEQDTFEGAIDEGEHLAPASDTEQMYQHWQQVMESTGFFNPLKPRKIHMRFRRLFNRAQLTNAEVKLMRGFLAAIKEYERPKQ